MLMIFVLSEIESSEIMFKLEGIYMKYNEYVLILIKHRDEEEDVEVGGTSWPHIGFPTIRGRPHHSCFHHCHLL